jgi:hypothetical protein
MPGEPAESGPREANRGGWYSYAILRVVPRVERGEYLNVGVILFERTRGFLETRIALDETRLRALAPDADLPAIRQHLDAIQAISAGRPEGGPIAALSPSERFHWLTAPRSTVIQPSPVHVGCCVEPATALEELVDAYVRPPGEFR